MFMRAFTLPVVAILSIVVGCSALVYAQDEKPEPDKSRQEEPNAKPKQDEAKPPHQDEAKPPKAEKSEEKQQQKQEQKEPQDQFKSNQQSHPQQQRAGDARPAGKGGHIPDDKFRAHFGRSHTFAARTVIVSGQPQFQYSGYTFELVDPWPQGWAYTDDCYIDYIDGEYFLFDLLHPGVRIAVTVEM
jgi:hypothetical protein